MISALEVRNFVNIASASLVLPAAGFCVLTGETGVGKSLLVDALSLLLGTRPKKNLIREGSETAEITAVFEIEKDSAAVAWLPENDLGDAGGELIVRRVLDRRGRSRCYINGTLATLTQLEALAGMLVGICGQNEHLKLRMAERRRFSLDTAAKATSQAGEVASCFANYKNAMEMVTAARERSEQVRGQVDHLSEDLAEINELGITSETWEENNRILDLQANAQELVELQARLQGGADSLGTLVAQSLPDSRRLAQLIPSTSQVHEDLESVESLSVDIARACAKLGEGLEEVDQKAYEEAERFVGEAHRIARKHRLVSAEHLIGQAQKMREKLDRLEMEDIGLLEEKASQCLESWNKAAAKLTAKRKGQAQKLAAGVQASLRKLGMPGARFAIELLAQPEPTRYGREDVEFLFAARARGAMNRVGDVASGGEMSRLTLALFCLTGGDGARALIFDEVDTGVGGRTAAHVGSLLAKLGQQRLVLCVTHLPQVAAAATRHWLVSADSIEGLATFTAISGPEREEEIARMLAGRNVTEASRSNAREILDSAAA